MDIVKFFRKSRSSGERLGQKRVIKVRTIEEAQKIVFPKTSDETLRTVDDALSFSRSANVSRSIKLRRLYEAADTLVAEVSPFSVCQEGCGHCCRIDVDVRRVEAEYIERNTGHRANTGIVRTSGHTSAKRACPFLDDSDRCRIYTVRPLACRVFLTFDNPVYCEDGTVQHVLYREKNHPKLSELDQEIERLNGRNGRRDIRDFFR
jgi:Fe-S-cluster containining protein